MLTSLLRAEECQRQAVGFSRKGWNPLHGIVAALDGIAIEIQQPTPKDCREPRKYFNRKGFFSICCQVAAGFDYKILYLSAKHPGSTHDSTACASTALATLLECIGESSDLPDWATVTADEAYANGGRLMTPFSGRGLPIWKDSFNYFLSSSRAIVEQTFGIIVSRWGIFWSGLRCRLKTSTLIIAVCCKLHNYLIEQKEMRASAEPPDPENRVEGFPFVWLQDELDLEEENQRSRKRCRENSDRRNAGVRALQEAGRLRPPRAP